MSESKIKLTGSEFEKALSLTISEIKDKVRKERAESSEKGMRLKSSPLLALVDGGNFTKDFIVREMPKLQNRSSMLSSGVRKVLEATISLAERRAVAMRVPEAQQEG